jgi:hypothetical protein
MKNGAVVHRARDEEELRLFLIGWASRLSLRRRGQIEAGSTKEPPSHPSRRGLSIRLNRFDFLVDQVYDFRCLFIIGGSIDHPYSGNRPAIA